MARDIRARERIKQSSEEEADRNRGTPVGDERRSNGDAPLGEFESSSEFFNIVDVLDGTGGRLVEVKCLRQSRTHGDPPQARGQRPLSDPRVPSNGGPDARAHETCRRTSRVTL